jgi:hypothetical protein
MYTLSQSVDRRRQRLNGQLSLNRGTPFMEWDITVLDKRIPGNWGHNPLIDRT